MRLTHALVQVALVLADRPFDRHWGYDLSKAAGVRSGVLYPMLQRMLDEGWVTDGWEHADETGGRRPPRRYYTLTDDGRVAIGGVIERAQSDARFAARYRWAVGG